MRLFHPIPQAVLALGALFLSIHPLPAQVKLTDVKGDHVSVEINGQPFTDFYYGSAAPKPYLWPVRTASGLSVTRNFPMKMVEGETRDHPHHRGLFIGYGEINDDDFWANETNSPTKHHGLITLSSLDKVKSGGKTGEIDATFDWKAPDATPLLTVVQKMVFSGDDKNRIIDFDVLFTSKVKTVWNDTKEGFFAIRLADSMREAKGGKMVNSESATGEKNVWGKPAKWVDYSGQVDGKPAGVTIMVHPTNPRYPERWHSRAYGLFAVNPWGLKDFVGNPSATGGGVLLEAGKQIRVRYRVLIHGSEVNPLNVPDYYREYTESVK